MEYEQGLTTEECDFLQELCAAPISMDAIDERMKKRQLASQRATMRTQRYRKKQQDELLYLRGKVKELEARYNQLLPKADTPALGKWERFAKSERKRAHETMQENLRLKQSIKQQIEFAESLAQIIKQQEEQLKQDDVQNQWQSFKLVADPVERRRAFDAIVDKEYAIIDSIFIQAGVMDDHQKVDSIEPKLLPNGEMEIVVKHSVRFTAPYALAVKAAWDIIRGAVPINNVPGKYEILQEMDATIVYTRAEWNHSLGTSQARYISKRYNPSDDRFVIITRSVMDDALLPLDPTQSICNEVAWLAIERVSKRDVCFRFCQKFRENKTLCDALTVEYLLDVFWQWSKSFDQVYTEYLTQLVKKRWFF